MEFPFPMAEFELWEGNASWTLGNELVENFYDNYDSFSYHIGKGMTFVDVTFCTSSYMWKNLPKKVDKTQSLY